MKIVNNILTQAAIWKRVCELIFNPRLTQEITNWPRLLADFIWPISGNFTLQLRRHGWLVIRGSTFDKWPVSEVIVRDDYRLHRLSAPKIIIDLGAGIGDFDIYASLLFPQVKIYAYEPDEDAYSLLTQNITRNALGHHVSAYKQAVTKKNAPDHLSIHQTKGYPSLMVRFPQSILLSATTVDRIFLQHRIEKCDLLKIDIEGAEYAVLYSLSAANFKKIVRIHLECHNFDGTKFNSRQLKKFLEQKGFWVEEQKNLDNHISMLYALNRNF